MIDAMMKNFLYVPFLLVMIAALALFSSCGDDTITRPSEVIFPESNVSFGRHVLPLFELGCNNSGCHNEIDQAGGVSLASYFHLFNRPGLVRPGDSSGSVLGQIVNGRLPHHSVPISLITSESQRKGILVWIQEGASNN